MPNNNDRNLPSTYQQVLSNRDDVTNINDKISVLDTGIDAAKIISVDGSQLSLSVIPQSALERVYDVSELAVLSSKSNPGYPTDAGNGDIIRDVGDGNMMYYISDETVLGTPMYVNGLKSFTAGHVADASTVNGHTVDSNVPANAKFTDTICGALCRTEGSVAMKLVTLDNYGGGAGSFKWFWINMMYSNTYVGPLAMQIDNPLTAVCPIYINDERSSADNYTLPAGCYLVYLGPRVINGVTKSTGFWFRTDGMLPHLGDNVPTIISSATQPTGLKPGDYWFEDVIDCNTSCTGGCSSACGDACTGSCGNSCGDACTGSCLGGCGDACTGCSGSCDGDCSSACGTTCGSGCDSSCSSDCGDACGGCGGGCDGCSGCGGSCDGDCSSACGSSCGDFCGGCGGGCDASCSDDCSSTSSGW